MASFLAACVNWLFGPVLLYDMVRTARRTRYVALRLLYILLLAVLLCWLYFLHTVRREGFSVPASEMANFAESFFYMFMGVQFAVVALLTPAYTGGAIAEEKERKTLEFVLATDLRNREIVLNKLVARLLNLTILVMAGLPLLAFLQFLGGVDPNLVLAGFAATGLTMFSLASLSILNSVVLKRARDAIMMSYLMAFAYLLLSSLALILLEPSLGIASFDLSFGSGLVTGQDVIEWLNAGNPIAILFLEQMKHPLAATPTDEVPILLRNYAIFHGAVGIACTTWAVLRIRQVALKQTYGTARKASLAGRLLGKPAIGQYPMVWKEVFAEPGMRLNWMGRIVLALLVIASFFPAAWILVDYVLERLRSTSGRNLGEEMNAWVRIVGTLVASLLLLDVAVRAAGRISGERDRQTLDSLLTSPLDCDAILFGKWLGSILSLRWGWVWLGLIWGLGMVTGGLHFLAMPFLVMAWIVYAAFLAVLGLWFSMNSKTTVRAHLYTLLTATGVGFGHWLIWMCCGPLMMFGRGGSGRGIEDWLMFQSFGLTPPVTLGALAFQGEEFRWFGSDNTGLKMVAYCLLGVFLYGVGTVSLWLATRIRFRALTHRTSFLKPEMTGAPSRQGLVPRSPEARG